MCAFTCATGYWKRKINIVEDRGMNEWMDEGR